MRSFSKRLTRRIVLALMLMMAVVTVFILGVSTSWMVFKTRYYYQALMDVENETIEKELYSVETAIANSIDDVEEHIATPEGMFAALKDELKNNPQVVGFFAAFEADRYPSQGRWFEPYAVWRDGQIETMQVGSDVHDYFSSEWYQKALQTDSGGYWSEPYFDEEGAKMLVCSYAVPIRDKDGRKIGVFGADVSLDWLHTQLLQLDVKSNRESTVPIKEDYKDKQIIWPYCFIVGRNGTYIAHPEKQRILRDNFFETMRQMPDSAAHKLLNDMDNGQRDYVKTVIDGVTSYVFYTPLEHTGWSMAIVVPRLNLLVPALAFCIVLLVIITLGLLAVYTICRITIQRSTLPLKFLAKSAVEVGKGNFNAPLPDLRHDDEIRLLRDSFGNMQQSLSQYIDELKTTTAQKTAIESELAIARDIQLSMLPTEFTDRSDIHIDAMLTPAKAVGGDFYDYFIREKSLYFCVGDVSGKGVPAALVMAMARSAFRLLAESESEPARIVGRMNDRMLRDSDSSFFITFFVGMLDLDTGHLRYCNAGHKAPYILSGELRVKSDGSVVSVLPVERNLPIAAMPDWEFMAQETVLSPGDMLFLYTDGLDEAEDACHQMFGKQRIKEHLQTMPRHPGTVIERMKQAVSNFVDGSEQSDDLTMLALQWKN